MVADLFWLGCSLVTFLYSSAGLHSYETLMGTVEDQLQRTMHISVEKPKLQIRSTYQMQQNSLGKRTISLPIIQTNRPLYT